MTSVRLSFWLVVASTAVVIAGGCNAWTPVADLSSSAAPTSPLLAQSRPASAGPLILRSQNPLRRESRSDNSTMPGSGEHYRHPMAVSGGTAAAGRSSPWPDNGTSSVQLAQYTGPSDAASLWSSYSDNPSQPEGYPTPQPPAQTIPPPSTLPNRPPPSSPAQQTPTYPGYPSLPSPPGSVAPGPGNGEFRNELPGPPSPYGGAPAYSGPPSGLTPPFGPGAVGLPSPASRFADLFINVQETQTGRIMVGAGINSDAGVTGQIIIDERNFDWKRVPTSLDDVMSGRAFRGAGQGFRVEALPGQEVQRYLVQFTEPYLGGTRVSMNLSGYLYDRRYFDWDEQRLGARFGLGYRLTPDLSLSVGVRGEQVDLSDPRVLGIPELDAALGRHDLYMGQITLTHDTRDVPFSPTEGHLLELNYSQNFGDFDYPRGEIDYRRYILLAERTDGSGRHVLGLSGRVGFTGSQTPIYENYFAGGHATMRGFEFREASPKVRGVVVGGEFLTLGSIEYLFPITADDMLKGVVFTDFGTVEQEIEFNRDNFRVALGTGLRIFIPAMGPAPIALDFAVPVARADTDSIENFSFFIGVGR